MSEQPSLRERVEVALFALHYTDPQDPLDSPQMIGAKAAVEADTDAVMRELAQHITEGLDEATEPLQRELGTGMALDLTRDILTALDLLLPSPEQEQTQ